jgi:copper homeostasis protein (lipoprotein)
MHVENAGQPPFRVSILYDPARIMEGHSYAVRARVSVGGNLMFMTDRAYPVLTQGHGSETPMMILRRAGVSAGGGGAGGILGALPASFIGVLPCADCPGIRYTLNLFAGNFYFLRLTYLERPEAKPFDSIGRWSVSGDGTTLMLTSGRGSIERFAVKGGEVLRKLDMQGREIDSKLNFDLRRSSTFEPIEPRLAMGGMFLYMADAASFRECQTGQRWPVAMEGAYKDVEAAYLKTRRQPGEEVMVNVEGQVAIRPKADGGGTTPTLVIERYTGIRPGEKCEAPPAAR